MISLDIMIFCNVFYDINIFLVKNTKLNDEKNIHF